MFIARRERENRCEDAGRKYRLHIYYCILANDNIKHCVCIICRYINNNDIAVERGYFVAEVPAADDASAVINMVRIDIIAVAENVRVCGTREPNVIIRTHDIL